MNTPAHIIINLFLLNPQDKAPILLTPVVAGSILPDASMFVFYFWEKVVLKTPERMIWSQSYYQPFWQTLSAISNSIPLVCVGLLISISARSRWGILLFSSMLLHLFGDFPLHSEDAHRHFFPFSDWRFHSPLSYWDPNHYGHIVGAIEFLTVIVGCLILLVQYQSWEGKLAVGSIFGLYLAYGVYVFSVWASTVTSNQ